MGRWGRDTPALLLRDGALMGFHLSLKIPRLCFSDAVCSVYLVWHLEHGGQALIL